MVKSVCRYLFTTIILTQSLAAQEPLFIHPVNIGKSVENELTSRHIVDTKTGNICLVLKYPQKVEYFLLNSDFKLIGKVQPKGFSGTVYLHDWKSIWSGYMGTDNKFHLIYAVKDLTHEKGKKYFFKNETIDFTKGTVTNKVYFYLDEGEELIQFVPTAKKNYSLVSNSKTDELILIWPKEDGTAEKKRIRFGLKEFYKEKGIDLNRYFYFSNFFGPAAETDIRVATNLTKVYHLDNKIFIVSTNSKEPPHLIEINVDNFQLIKRKLKMDGFCQSFTNSNSHVFDGKLYVINSCKEQIEIGIFDPFTEQLFKKLLISKDYPIEFNDSPSKTRGIVGVKTKESEINLKELVKLLTKRSLGIAITKNENGQLVLECGGYDEAPKWYTYEMATTINHVYYKASFGTSFKIVLDPITFEHLKDASPQSNYEYQSGIFEKTRNWIAKNRFIINNKGYMGYYDPALQAYVIEELPVLQ